MNKNTVLIIVAVVMLGIEFFAGMEYKAYQLRKIFSEGDAQIEKASNAVFKDESVMEEAKKEDFNEIVKSMGDEVEMATLKFKINKVEEQQTISSSYSSPKVAKEGTKFVVLDLDVTNTTNSSFSFYPDEGFTLVDDKKREFQPYDETIGSIENYINSRELSPSVMESGVLVYELPNDSTSYKLVAFKAGSKDMFSIVLK